MGFRNDFSQAQQPNGIKPKGDYEVIIARADERTNKNGKTSLNLGYIIRNDIDQPYKNGWIFQSLWKHREPTQADMQVNGYGFNQIMALGQAAQLPDGKEYAGLADFLGDLMRKPVCVHITHEEYNGEMRENVSYIKPTRFPEVRHVQKEKPAQTGYAAAPQTGYAAPQSNYATQPGGGFAFADDGDIPF